jgi:hypothetical protein
MAEEMLEALFQILMSERSRRRSLLGKGVMGYKLKENDSSLNDKSLYQQALLNKASKLQ